MNESAAVHKRGTGTHTGGVPRYNVYAAGDGRYLAVGAQEKKFWDALCDALGLPDLKEKHQPSRPMRPLSPRVSRRPSRGAAPPNGWRSSCRSNCCVSAVATCEEAFADPHFAARGTVHNGSAGIVLGMPLAMSGLAAPVERASPARGEHSAAILARLGYAASDVEGLRARGVI
jgi:crotonobetainyl-CoA:carnitine CoA-transferase CaiB-like acyl-CoA transferase